MIENLETLARTACPTPAGFALLIGGYRTPHEYPAGGQQRSNPLWQKVCEEIAGVSPDETGNTDEVVAVDGVKFCV